MVNRSNYRSPRHAAFSIHHSSLRTAPAPESTPPMKRPLLLLLPLLALAAVAAGLVWFFVEDPFVFWFFLGTLRPSSSCSESGDATAVAPESAAEPSCWGLRRLD